MVRRKQVRPNNSLVNDGESFEDEATIAVPSRRLKKKKTQRELRNLKVPLLELPCQEHSFSIICISLRVSENVLVDDGRTGEIVLVEEFDEAMKRMWHVGCEIGGTFSKWDLAALGLNQKVLEAWSQLLSAGCIGMKLQNSQLTIHVDFARSKKKDAICVFMAWLILSSKEQWRYPYIDELHGYVYNGQFAVFHKDQILDFISPVTSSIAGENLIPNAMLLPTLRPYQRAAVAWMLKRENEFNAEDLTIYNKATMLHATHRSSGKIYNVMNGVIGAFNSNRNSVYGGILADEMGLGKTVQVLACILSHPCPTIEIAIPLNTLNTHSRSSSTLSCACNSTEEHPDGWVQCDTCSIWQHKVCTGYTEGAFYCELCLRSKVPQWAAKTTLIISPFTINKQWEQEIIRHTKPGSLTVYTYTGIKSMRDCYPGPSPEWRFCRASELSKFDVVLTTYETLRYDVYHVPTERTGSLRGEKKYRKVLSPLTHLFWWRICMDEAQLVERTQAKAALLANQLSSQYRWWVTGTPFSTSLEDVFGTFVFLQFDPFQDKHYWRTLVEKNSSLERLKDTLRLCMWRNRKIDVLDQIGLPPQTTEYEWLELTDIEQHYYQQQLQLCTKSHPRHGEVTSQMLLNLTRLRQACCHPQVGSQDLRTVNGGFVMTMDEILDQMQSQAKRECEDAMRALIAALNGLAGITMLEGNFDTAVGIYYDAIALIQHHWKDFQTDLLPRLHIAHNFAKLLERFVSTTPVQTRDNPDQTNAYKREEHGLPILKDLKPIIGPGFGEALKNNDDERVLQSISELRVSASCIEKYYLMQLNGLHDVSYQKYQASYKENQNNYFASHSNIEQMTQAFLKKWCKPFEYLDDTILERLRATWLSRSSTSQRLSSRFNSVAGLLFEIQKEFSRIFESRSNVHATLTNMSQQTPSREDIEISGNCKHCRQDRRGPLCQHCIFQPELDDFRSCIGERADVFGGTSIGTVLVEIVRDVASTCGTRKEYEEVKNCIADLLHESTLATKLFQAQHARLGGLDELEMAKMTLQLDAHGLSNELFKVAPGEIPIRRMELEGDNVVATGALQEKLSQLRYLQHLHTSRQPSASNSTEEECVICHEKMPPKRAIWSCAHVFCWPCSKAILRRANGSRARCPTCRRVSLSSAIRLVRDKTSQEPPKFGTKIDAILRCIKRLGREKILLFSQWPDMLLIVATALKEESIPCYLLEHKKFFHSTISAFKAVDGVCVLALPFRHGANGLNLVEASHVILVEPHLNESVEKQAINRIHRLGQDKPTVVHRFIVQNSIEEGILSLQANKVSNAHKKPDKEEITSNEWKLLLHQDSIATHDAFWSKAVSFQDKILSRGQCKSNLERIRSYDLHESGQRIVDEATINLCGVDVNLHVAVQLLSGKLFLRQFHN
ncbi:hypothetical protein THRCLA_04813 [Thraustotheca clavata]|uniref:E3 ubiquitin-protein ligase SHPRH n=1 Tax=Thraustotheca clavata TaxID=74557 RepID=A0A1V9ZYH9_9STRA|nr:hypothetical protein THRCLA_04813 [Thraustotheca clavata]